jgi:hypothetical protein
MQGTRVTEAGRKISINKIIWGLVVVLVTLTVAFSWNSPTSGQDYTVASQATPTPEIRDTRDLSKYGIVDYESHLSLTGDEWEKRRSISQRYDNQEWVSKTMDNLEIGGIGRIQDLPPPPLFPFEESRLVVVGEVVKAEAFLSNDKEGVYTELTIRIDEVLKGAKDSKQKKEIVADRGGGVVRYPNGQRVRYESSERGLPVVGSQYLFFLIKDEISANYEILTSYEFRDGKVRQMEAGQPFEDFKNTDKRAFLGMVRHRLQESDQ